ncbi:phage portal protein (plasmid) [Clostridium perfringens]|uniref:Phage portal protein, HK97 family n=1 Tax=Clostridium perfringens E str. JGS1987 TaxID=451755 RepID=B1BUB6_CLOPF|nr:phage portal protein [Clostridium perfringens]EDT14690.1 phage portal protein, HK97 family [Clostridium perfringens E str. JGS1987]EJT6557637.1 phage portal protein [Clostridium perfringens]
MFLDKIAEKRSESNNTYDFASFLRGENIDTTNALNNSTYIKSINILADTIAKLPILLKKTTENGEIEATEQDLYTLLRLRSNKEMSAFDVIKSLILTYKHYGIAGLYIIRDNKGVPTALYPVQINSIIIDNLGLIKSIKQNKIVVDFSCGNSTGSCFLEDIIILKDNSFDGVNGKSVRNYAKDSINTNLQAQKYQKDLFENGLTSKAVVQTVTDIKDGGQLGQVQEKFNNLYKSNNRVFLVPAGFNISPLNLSLVDSQFAELKVDGKKEIANIIGVPYKLIDNGVLTEEENISFLTNNISPIITQLEQELNYKLLTNLQIKQGYKIRFNVNVMLRVNPKVQQEILCNYIKNGVYTTNDVREILGFSKIEGADILTYPSGQVTLENIISGEASWLKGGEKNGKTTEGN